MTNIQQVRCPNCGSYAEKQHFPAQNLISVSCSHCDYLIITCPTSGKVVEAYAPGIKMKK